MQKRKCSFWCWLENWRGMPCTTACGSSFSRSHSGPARPRRRRYSSWARLTCPRCIGPDRVTRSGDYELRPERWQLHVERMSDVSPWLRRPSTSADAEGTHGSIVKGRSQSTEDYLLKRNSFSWLFSVLRLAKIVQNWALKLLKSWLLFEIRSFQFSCKIVIVNFVLQARLMVHGDMRQFSGLDTMV